MCVCVCVCVCMYVYNVDPCPWVSGMWRAERTFFVLLSQ